MDCHLRCWSSHLHVVGDSMVVAAGLARGEVNPAPAPPPATLPSQSFVDQHL